MEYLKILVVDDSDEIRIFISMTLLLENHLILEANNGEDALIKAAEQKPDLIIMDIMMPRMDGIEATRRLKSDPQTMDIPVIMLTALLETEMVLKSYEYGADYYLSKPLNKDDLLKAIRFVERVKNRQV